MSIPIIFIHQGWGFDLDCAVRGARRSNPDAPIWVLNGRKSEDLSGRWGGVNVVDDDEMFQGAADFALIYRHLSAHAAEFERFCFQRWFMLSAFLQRSGIERCLVLDSDVLLFADVSRDAERFSGCDLTHLSHTGPLNGFINAPAMLDAFCSHITRSFTEDLPRWTTWFARAQAQGVWGGVSDMTIFHDFRRGFPTDSPRFADLTAIENGIAYDHSIHSPDGYKMRFRRKVLRPRDGFPEAFHLPSGRWIRFHSIHFQGPSKPLMRGALHGNRAQWLTAAARIERDYFLARVKNRLRRWRRG